MRESIGAAWLTIIVMTFIVLFSGFLAFSVNYSKAFRIKDGIVERIEEYNGFNDSAVNDINSYMGEINYNSKGNCSLFVGKNVEGVSNSGNVQVPYAGVSGTNVKVSPNERDTYNYCVQKVSAYFSSQSNTMSSAYYKVVVFFSLQIGNINLGLSSNFNVTGETITMYYPSDSYF